MKIHLKSICLLILFTAWYFINEIYPILTVINTITFYNYILLYSGLGLIVYSFCFLKTRQSEKSWLIAQTLLIFLLLYGFFKDKTGMLFSFFSKHTVAISLWTLLNGFIIFKVYRSKHRFVKFQKTVSVCIFLFLAYSLFSILTQKKYELRSENILTQVPDSKDLPNLYIFVFDELARIDQLEQFGYSGEHFKQKMDSLGVHYIPHSYSYADLTPLCISSTLNAFVTNTGDLRYPLNNYQKVMFWNEYKKNYLQPYLKKLGYDTRLFGIIPFEELPSYTNYNFLNKATTTSLRHNTFMGRINEDLAWNFVKYNVPVLKELFLKEENKYNYRLYKNDSINLAAINQILDNDTIDKPLFVMGHLLFPHYPYSRDTLGNFQYVTALPKEIDERSEDYIAQAKYAEKVILELAEKISEETAPTIAIFMGDHGYRWKYDSSLANKSFLAYYTNLDSLPVNDSTSSVNLMRMILNEYYGFDLPEDSSTVKLLFY